MCEDMQGGKCAVFVYMREGWIVGRSQVVTSYRVQGGKRRGRMSASCRVDLWLGPNVTSYRVQGGAPIHKHGAFGRICRVENARCLYMGAKGGKGVVVGVRGGLYSIPM